MFMEIQGSAKCCFCEKKYENSKLGQYELDIEHFRPKGNVRLWNPGSSLAGNGFMLTAPDPARSGYYLLPYHLWNYVVACKPCNSGLKKDYFPISARYDLNGADPWNMKGEKPWLIYPIGRLDDDPEDAIDFYGYLPRSKATDRHLKLRGIVTIIFFSLDDAILRKELLKERALIIILLQVLLRKAKNGDQDSAKEVNEMLKPTSRHTNCARSFKRLFDSDEVEAAKVAEVSEKFYFSGSPL